MCQSLEKLFFLWFPSDAKKPMTANGRRVHKTMICACTIHIILFFFSFAVVGFNSMLLNLIDACWTYSIYLTLREKQMIFYLLLLAIGTIEGVFNLFFEELGNLQILGKMINIVVYIVIGYIVGKNYFLFRHDGGLHGKARQVTNSLLASELGQVASKKAGDAAGAVGLVPDQAKENKV